MATLSATGNCKVQAGFSPLLSEFIHVDFDDIEAIKKYNENQRDKEEHFRENIDYVREQEALKIEKKEKLIKEKQETKASKHK